MIEGIEILAQSEIMTDSSWTAWILVLLAFGFVVFTGGLSNNIDFLVFIGCIALSISIVGSLLMVIINPKEPTGKYEYQVTIDENVSFTELYEKYEVVDQNGKIWVIRDKDVEDVKEVK